MNHLKDLVVDPNNPRSLSARSRRGRWNKFLEEFGDISKMRIIDLGGTPDFWRNVEEKPAHVTVVNLRDAESSTRIRAVKGDACNPPPDLLGENFDLAISNSLLEHVGGHAQRARLADVIHQCASRHWVQTPYRYFPIEPHWMAPGFQFLPFEARVRLSQRWKIGHIRTQDRKTAIERVNEIELIGISQMTDYFPNSEIWREKSLSLTKSIVAIQR
ncbi:class I SAM-dependent methyltransferase [Gordonia sp. SCSIO 19800]|uniref:class I SAM-dependent methyltransferase n=1 Tax=Gordonia sp. SCSIO 19800 TaxID=2826926 RepID=UPI001B8305B5|nr:class I SAM-dependent methyltransferase [Gordonia sp. SCSIO 19800]MBR7191554.1 class I SAM-dependent methyltransferase [Gordonia sp. SCSIO 19800]